MNETGYGTVYHGRELQRSYYMQPRADSLTWKVISACVCELHALSNYTKVH